MLYKTIPVEATLRKQQTEQQGFSFKTKQQYEFSLLEESLFGQVTKVSVTTLFNRVSSVTIRSLRNSELNIRPPRLKTKHGQNCCAYRAAMVWNSLPNDQGRLRWGAGGAAAPSALIHGWQEGQELPFILVSFHRSYLFEGAFSGISDSLLQENFREAPLTTIQSLGD